jgi:hypothetical protein
MQSPRARARAAAAGARARAAAGAVGNQPAPKREQRPRKPNRIKPKLCIPKLEKIKIREKISKGEWEGILKKK